MRNIILTSFYILMLFACKHLDNSENAHTATDSSATQSFYPFPQYIQSQVAYVDSVPLGIEMMRFYNGIKTDSTFIDRSKFKQLAKEFLEIDPNQNNFRGNYEETSFKD